MTKKSKEIFERKQFFSYDQLDITRLVESFDFVVELSVYIHQ